MGAGITISSDSAGGDVVNIHVIDLSNDTVVASALMSGYTAHDSSGQAITGSLVGPSGSISITSNGEYDVSAYASASVDIVSGYTINDIAGGAPSGDIEITRETIVAYAFTNKAGITSARGTSTTINTYAFYNCTNATSFCFPNISIGASYVFNNCGKLEAIVIKNPNGKTSWARNINGSQTLAVDIVGSDAGAIGNQSFDGSSALGILILRKPSIVALNNVNAFGSTKFKSGGTGGTIYIPKSLYDHLGDNSSSDYKKATNWTTLNGYGTVTWEKIEGSYYETHYADGTLIPTT